ncbi:hypothetical protein RHP75_02175 [Pseudomonas sp. SG20056]|uniref:DUF4145 domain-containing protein n=1 Tax=Pseudomonas sp. SG20056 TaxID=3074146 RepID=UPI00287FEB2B|nr:DUF4145 domain-containing protein [Pseudomonas sp. SG20056]WNF47266.1 hypothetical protein RHP75_02175 [Pseudomonas sp. SG20056]
MSHIQVKVQQRFDELLAIGARIPLLGRESHSADTQAFYTWAASVLSLFHGVFGTNNPHYTRFNNEMSAIQNNYIPERALQACRGIFMGAKSDVEGGYIFNIEKSVTGELFGDLVALAKASLAEGHHTVATVLASAALEDALKRFAIANSLDVEGNTMDQVVNSLKSQGLISGPQKALLAAMPKIRNQAMHANWDKLTPQDAGSMVGFVEHFLLSNFT